MDPAFSPLVFLPQDFHDFSGERVKFASNQAMLGKHLGPGRIGCQVG